MKSVELRVHPGRLREFTQEHFRAAKLSPMAIEPVWSDVKLDRPAFYVVWITTKAARKMEIRDLATRFKEMG